MLSSEGMDALKILPLPLNANYPFRRKFIFFRQNKAYSALKMVELSREGHVSHFVVGGIHRG